MNEIVVISSYPERDIQEFITYFKPYIDKYKYPKLYLKDGHILRFQSNNNLIGVRKHYYYSEIFKSYSRSCITTLQQEIERLNNIIKNLDKMFEYYFIGNKKYDENTVNTIYIKYIKLKELRRVKNDSIINNSDSNIYSN